MISVTGGNVNIKFANVVPVLIFHVWKGYNKEDQFNFIKAVDTQTPRYSCNALLPAQDLHFYICNVMYVLL